MPSAILSWSWYRCAIAKRASLRKAVCARFLKAKLRSIDCTWGTNKGPARATISDKGLQIEIDLHGVDPAFSGSMKLNYKRTIPDDALQQLPATSLRLRVTPDFVYRAAGARPKS